MDITINPTATSYKTIIPHLEDYIHDKALDIIVREATQWRMKR